MAGTSLLSPIVVRGLLTALDLNVAWLDRDTQDPARMILHVHRHHGGPVKIPLPIGRTIDREEIVELLTGKPGPDLPGAATSPP